MHAGFFIDLATNLSFSPNSNSESKSNEFVQSEQFWQLTKDRMEHWKKTLAMFQDDLAKPSQNHSPWTAISCVIEEILCSEFFARIVAASFVRRDEEIGSPINAPVARAVMLFHLEARLRALEIIEQGLETNVPEARRLNDLRKKLERWCDLLLTAFPKQIAMEFSFEPSRHQEYERDIHEDAPERQKTVKRLFRLSIRDFGRRLVKRPSANPTLNRKIADLFAFAETQIDADPRDSFSNFQTQSINDLTDDAQRWIDDYLTVGESTS